MILINLQNSHIKTDNWSQTPVSSHTSIWSKDFEKHLNNPCPWEKKKKVVEPIIAKPTVRHKKKVVNLVTRYVPETQDER